MSALLVVEHLQKRYPVGHGSLLPNWLAKRLGRRIEQSYLHAVDDVSFEIREGESLGLVGESGCGKSTLVRLLARLIDPSAGSIRLKDREIGAIPASRFGTRPERRDLQVVFQDPHESLNPRFTAFRSIADPLLRLEGMRSGRDLRKRVAGLAEMVGLPVELLPRFPHQLSGGQKARVNIARAIAVNPRVLILDEPTSALDVSVQAVILHLLEDLKGRLGMSYLFVSHDLNVVRLLCDRVAVMYLGKLVEVAPAETLFERSAHPYTRALVSAIPSHTPDERASRVRLDGEPRSPVDPDPKVCRFYGRCPQGTLQCQESAPILKPMGEDQAVACHLV